MPEDWVATPPTVSLRMIVERGLTPAALTLGLHRHPVFTPKSGYLHLPKTGGTGIKDFLLANLPLISRMPLQFSHPWTLRMIRSAFPELRLSLLLRDPLERTISAFQSRLRMGRPRCNVPWRPEERVVFEFYPTVEHFLSGLASRDSVDLEMTRRSFQVIPTLRWGYQHCFESVEAVLAAKDCWQWLGDVTLAEQMLDRWMDENVLVFRPPVAGTNPVPYARAHQSPRVSSDYLAGVDRSLITMFRQRLAVDYQIFDALQGMATAG